MKKTNLLLRILSAVVCIVLIAVMGLVLTSCDKSKNDGATSSVTSSDTSSVSSADNASSEPADGYGNAPTDVGNGKVSFIFRVTDKEGYDTLFRVYTNEKTVGDALQKVGLIEGEMGDYGLYVKKVNGIVADYDIDKTYWAFYINNEYAMTGVDKTDVTPNAEYQFKVEK